MELLGWQVDHSVRRDSSVGSLVRPDTTSVALILVDTSPPSLEVEAPRAMDKEEDESSADADSSNEEEDAYFEELYCEEPLAYQNRHAVPAGA